MFRIIQPSATAAVMAEHPVATVGRYWVRYGLVVVIAWIGALKYTSYEAAAIQPLIAHSPLFSWLYSAFSVRAFAVVLGTAEIIAALLIAIRPLAPRISALGSAMGVLLFLSTLSFLFTTPGATAASGFPVLSVLPGQFLLKDLVLAAAALWTLGDALGAAPGRRGTHGGEERRRWSQTGGQAEIWARPSKAKRGNASGRNPGGCDEDLVGETCRPPWPPAGSCQRLLGVFPGEAGGLAWSVAEILVSSA